MEWWELDYRGLTKEGSREKHFLNKSLWGFHFCVYLLKQLHMSGHFFQNLVLINRFWSWAVSKLLVSLKKHSLCDLTLLSQMPLFFLFHALHYSLQKKKNYTNVINLISQREKENLLMKPLCSILHERCILHPVLSYSVFTRNLLLLNSFSLKLNMENPQKCEFFAHKRPIVSSKKFISIKVNVTRRLMTLVCSGVLDPEPPKQGKGH